MGVIVGLARFGAGMGLGGPEAGRGAGCGFLAMRGSFMGQPTMKAWLRAVWAGGVV